jgi:hypothetical protein
MQASPPPADTASSGFVVGSVLEHLLERLTERVKDDSDSE